MLRVAEIDRPVIEAGEVLVQVRAASLDRDSWHLMAGLPYALGAETIADYARQGVALLRRDFREGPHDELGWHRAIVCRSSDPIELMIDGERATGSCEERFEVVTANGRMVRVPARFDEAVLCRLLTVIERM